MYDCMYGQQGTIVFQGAVCAFYTLNLWLHYLTSHRASAECSDLVEGHTETMYNL